MDQANTKQAFIDLFGNPLAGGVNRETTITKDEAIAVQNALANVTGELNGFAGQSVQRPKNVPSKLNGVPMQIIGLIASPDMYTSREIYKLTTGSTASETLTFTRTDLLAGEIGKVFAGIHIKCDYIGEDNTLVSPFVVAGTGQLGSIALVSEYRSMDRSHSELIIPFSALYNGETVLNPAKVGTHLTSADGAAIAGAVITLAITFDSALNKSFTVTLLNAASPDLWPDMAKLLKV